MRESGIAIETVRLKAAYLASKVLLELRDEAMHVGDPHAFVTVGKHSQSEVNRHVMGRRQLKYGSKYGGCLTHPISTSGWANSEERLGTSLPTNGTASSRLLSGLRGSRAARSSGVKMP